MLGTEASLSLSACPPQPGKRLGEVLNILVCRWHSSLRVLAWEGGQGSKLPGVSSYKNNNPIMRAPSSSTIWIGRIGKGQNSVQTKPLAIPYPAMTYMIARVLFFQYNLVKCQPGSRLQDIMTQLSAPTLTPIPHPIEHLHSDLLHPLFRPFHTVKSRIYHPAPPFWIPILLSIFFF